LIYDKFKEFLKLYTLQSILSKLNLENFKHHLKAKNLKFLLYFVHCKSHIGSYIFQKFNYSQIFILQIGPYIFQIDPYQFF